jgi:glycosyltransferase involved in cell wall biosynthesis
MRVIAITQIWPNGLEPLSSPFNAQQFEHLARTCDLSVLAAIAYFPAARHLPRPIRPPRPALLHALPDHERIRGIDTYYVRQLYVPKIGVLVAVPLYLASLAPHRARIAEADVVLGTWAYPDGCASILAARALGKPVVVKVHGSDLNVIARRPSARAVMKRVLPRADAMVAVSAALGDELAALGVDRARIHLVPNGVDGALFYPRDKRASRAARSIPADARVVSFVGRLEPQKGIRELLAAIPLVRERVPGAVFVLLGDGDSREEVARAARESPGAIVAPGARPLAEIAEWLGASDVFTLPSWMEGTPNVVLEALASGRPVVATRVGGIPHVVRERERERDGAGFLVPPRDERALASAIVRALEIEWDAGAVRALGPRSWEESARGLFSVLDAARENAKMHVGVSVGGR